MGREGGWKEGMGEGGGRGGAWVVHLEEGGFKGTMQKFVGWGMQRMGWCIQSSGGEGEGDKERCGEMRSLEMACWGGGGL